MLYLGIHIIVTLQVFVWPLLEKQIYSINECLWLFCTNCY